MSWSHVYTSLQSGQTRVNLSTSSHPYTEAETWKPPHNNFIAYILIYKQVQQILY